MDFVWIILIGLSGGFSGAISIEALNADVMLPLHHLLDDVGEAVLAERPVLDLFELLTKLHEPGRRHKAPERGKQLRVFPSFVGAKHPNKVPAGPRYFGPRRVVRQSICRCMPQDYAGEHSAHAVLLTQGFHEAAQRALPVELRKQKLLLEHPVIVLDEAPDHRGRPVKHLVNALQG